MNNESILTDLISVLDPYPMNALIASALRFCFKNPYEGLMIVDTDGIIHFMDRPSEKFLGLEPGGAQGRSIRELVPKSDFELVMKSGAPVIGRIREISGVMRMASVYPLKKDGVIIGAIGRRVFHPYEEIEKRNKEIQEPQERSPVFATERENRVQFCLHLRQHPRVKRINERHHSHCKKDINARHGCVR